MIDVSFSPLCYNILKSSKIFWENLRVTCSDSMEPASSFSPDQLTWIIYKYGELKSVVSVMRGQRSPEISYGTCRMVLHATPQPTIFSFRQTSLQKELSHWRLKWCGRRTVLTATLSTSSSGGTSCSMCIAPSLQLLMSWKKLLKILFDLLILTWSKKLVLQQGRDSRS